MFFNHVYALYYDLFNLNGALPPDTCRWLQLAHRLLFCAWQGASQRGLKFLDAWVHLAVSTGPCEYSDHVAALCLSLRDDMSSRFALILFISTMLRVSYFSFSPLIHISTLLVPFDFAYCMLWLVWPILFLVLRFMMLYLMFCYRVRVWGLWIAPLE